MVDLRRTDPNEEVLSLCWLSQPLSRSSIDVHDVNLRNCYQVKRNKRTRDVRFSVWTHRFWISWTPSMCCLYKLPFNHSPTNILLDLEPGTPVVEDEKILLNWTVSNERMVNRVIDLNEGTSDPVPKRWKKIVYILYELCSWLSVSSMRW